MIKEAYIKNYQSHKETRLSFHAGVNVIIGSSDSGKSSLIRALNWCINNKPAGDDFRSDWGGDTEVVLTITQEGKRLPEQIHRLKKGTDVNEYKYNRNDGKKIQIFKSFKQGVPDEIVKAFNMTDLNFQFQIEKPFLMSETSGEVAKYLNKVADLDDIDRSVSGALSFKRKAEKRLIDLESEEADYKVDLEKYSTLSEIEKEYSNLEKKYNEMQGLEESVETLSDLIDSIVSLEKTAKKFILIPTMDAYLGNLLKLDQGLKDTEVDIESITLAIERIMELERKIKKCNQILLHQKEIEALSIIALGIEEKEKEISELISLIDSIEEIEEGLTNAKEQYSKYSKEFDTTFPDTCPLCGESKRVKKD